eukprot:4946773-Alexandrium_andersonii.AAC.1
MSIRRHQRFTEGHAERAARCSHSRPHCMPLIACRLAVEWASIHFGRSKEELLCGSTVVSSG